MQNPVGNVVVRTLALVALAIGVWSLVDFMVRRGILDPTALVLLTAASFLIQLAGQALPIPLPLKLQALLDGFFLGARRTGLWWVEAALTTVAPFLQAVAFGVLVLFGQWALMAFLVDGLGVNAEPAQVLTPLLSLAFTIFALSLLARRYKPAGESYAELKAAWADITGPRFKDVHPVAMLAFISVMRALVVWGLKAVVVGWSSFFFDWKFAVFVLVVIFFAAVIPEQTAKAFTAVKKAVSAARKEPQDVRTDNDAVADEAR